MSQLGWAIADVRVAAWRNVMKLIRIPALFVFSIVQPVMFVLLFRYVFGGAVQGLPEGVNYVSYLLPGIFVQTSIFGASNTGIGLAEDMASGIVDRFRSLPMARSAVLLGRTLADLHTAIFLYGVISEDVVANSDVVAPLKDEPVVYANLGQTQSEWLQPAAHWFVQPQQWSVLRAANGQSWSRPVEDVEQLKEL